MILGGTKIQTSEYRGLNQLNELVDLDQHRCRAFEIGTNARVNWAFGKDA
jgi:hypothetical protein